MAAKDRLDNAKHNVEVTSVAKFEFEGKVEIQVKSIIYVNDHVESLTFSR